VGQGQFGPHLTHSRHSSVAGCAIPTSFAGRALTGAKSNHELTFKPSHLVGADQGATVANPD
jgi:hypothetical protein